MAVEISGRYLGNKRVELTHGPSGARVSVTPPVDNGGDGSSFSPTDLTAGSLGACMLTVMALVAERDQVDLSGMYMKVEKHMEQNPRRIGALPLVIHLPKLIPQEYRAKLERVAYTCPVHHSLSTDIKIDVTFAYDV